MDFKFININTVVGVVSCKAHVSSIDQKHKDYISQMTSFTKNIWLFSEYCNFNTYNKLKTRAKGIGYKDFWCLYEWNEKEAPKVKIDVWEAFDKKIIALAKKY